MAKEEKKVEKKKAESPTQLQASLQEVRDKFPEVTGEDPYMMDAQSFLDQAIACLGKQIRTNV